MHSTEVLISSRTARQVCCSSGLQRPRRSSSGRDMLRCLVGGLVALVAIEVHAQVRLPDGWVTDYDYEENLSTYLQRQHDAAADRKLVPYVYLYAEWCRACVELRHRVVENPDFAQVFAGTHIVALDFDSLRSVNDKPAVLTLGAPMIIPIESDGTLGKIAVNGVPWQRAPSDVFEVLCSFFEGRAVPGTVVDRGCPQVPR